MIAHESDTFRITITSIWNDTWSWAGVLRADAALLSPLGLSGYVLGQVADALESIGEHELEGAA